MAINAGTCFVEISLDDKVYKQKLSETLTSTEATAKGIETSWKALGVKNDATYDAQRRAYENAMTLIKNSTTSTAQDIIRAEEAKNAKIKQLNEQQFGHQDTLIESVKKNWLALAGIIAVAYKAVGAVSDIVMAAARYETLGIVMKVVGNNAGYTSEQMEGFAKGLEKTGISMAGSRETLTRMAQAQLDLTQATKLGRVAQDAAVIGNINSSEAFQRLVYGIQSAQVEMLRTIGINVNFENAYKSAEKQLGKNRDAFSESEKAAIRMNVVLEAGAGIAGTYEAAMGTAGKQMLSLERHFDNLKVLAGAAFTPALAEIVKMITGTVTDLNEELSGKGLKAIQAWGEGFREGIIRTVAAAAAPFQMMSSYILDVVAKFYLLERASLTVKAWTSFGDAAKLYGEAAKEAGRNAEAAMLASNALTEKANANVDLMWNGTKKLTDAEKEKAKAAEDSAETQRIAAGKVAQAAKKAAEEEAAQAKAKKEAMKQEEKNSDDLAKSWKIYYDNQEKELKQQNEAYKKSEDEKIKASDKAREELKKIQLQSTTDFLLAQEKMIEDQGVTLNKKYFAELEAARKYKELATDQYEFGATENERAINKIIADAEHKEQRLRELAQAGKISETQLQNDLIQLNENKNAAIIQKETSATSAITNLHYTLVSNIRGKETEAYNARLAQITAETAKHQLEINNQLSVETAKLNRLMQLYADGKVGFEAVQNQETAIAQIAANSQVALTAWKKEQERLAYIAMGYQADGWVGGVKAGLLDLEGKHKTWADQTKQMTVDWSNASKNAFTDIFKQAFTTGTVDMGQVWSNFTGAMVTSFSNVMGSLVQEALEKGIKMLFEADWTETSNNVLGIINGALNLWNDIEWAQGGQIPGTARVSGDSRVNDTVFARVSPGEYIVPRTAVNSQTLPALEYLRSNKRLPMYAEGGMVNPDWDAGAAYLRNYPDIFADVYWANYPRLHYDTHGQYEGRLWPTEPPHTNPSTDPIYFLKRYMQENGKFDQEPAAVATGLARDAGKRFKWGAEGQDAHLTKWAEVGQAARYGFFNTDGGYEGDWRYTEWVNNIRDSDEIAKMILPGSKDRIFYQNDTYSDYPWTDSHSNSWFFKDVSPYFTGVVKAALVAATTYVSGGLLGPYIGAAAATGVGAATSTYLLTHSWEAALIAGVTAALASAISSYFSDAGATNGSQSVIGDYEYDAYANSQNYTDALYSNVGNGSTPAWYDNILNSAKKFLVKGIAKNAIKIGAGKLGANGQSQGHATFSYDSTDDQGVFGILSGLMDSIAPKSTALNLSFAGGGGFPALNGLPYVPRDNFPIRAHEGEAVLTKKEAQQWRGGGSNKEIIIHNHLYIDGKEVTNSVVRGIRAGDDDLIKYIRKVAA